MDEKRKAALRTHAFRLAHAALTSVTQQGSVLVADPGGVHEDLVATHHVLEVAHRLHPDVFRHYTTSMLTWMASDERNIRLTPFEVDSMTLVHRGTPALKEILEREIVNYRLEDGSYDKFTAYTMGGDYFSTLWCTKILINSGIPEFADPIRKALDYLIGRRPVAAKTVGQSGYLLLLLARFDYGSYGQVADSLAAEVREVLGKRIASPSEQLLDSLFLVEDLVEHALVSGSEESLEGACDFLNAALQLEEEPSRMPLPMQKAFAGQPMSVQLETLCRAAISAAATCRVLQEEGLEYDVNALLQAGLQETTSELANFKDQLGGYLSMYEDMHREFKKYDEALARINRTTPKDRSVFIMMPFRESDLYTRAADVVKEECAKAGFKAFRVDDPDRQFEKTIWENLLVNMLSAKYAIAIYVSWKVIDRVDDERKTFQSPNVALEFGFFLSRGQQVLVLKDEKSDLPTDVGGFRRREFSIEKASSVSAPVAEWLASLESGPDDAPADAHNPLETE